jgi:hypothetical protein
MFVTARKPILATQRYFGSPGRLQTKLRQGWLNYVAADRAGNFCLADAMVAKPMVLRFWSQDASRLNYVRTVKLRRGWSRRQILGGGRNGRKTNGFAFLVPGRLQTKLRQGRLNYVGADRAGKFCVADASVAKPMVLRF